MTNEHYFQDYKTNNHLNMYHFIFRPTPGFLTIKKL